MRDTKRPHLHTSGDHRPTIALAAVTGQALRLAASGVGDLRMDWGQGTLVGAKGLASLELSGAAACNRDYSGR